MYAIQPKECPTLDSNWVGSCRVLEIVEEVVYRVQLPPRGRRVVLHRDRLASYRGHSHRSLLEECVENPASPAHMGSQDGLSFPPRSPTPEIAVTSVPMDSPRRQKGSTSCLSASKTLLFPQGQGPYCWGGSVMILKRMCYFCFCVHCFCYDCDFKMCTGNVRRPVVARGVISVLLRWSLVFMWCGLLPQQ